jgi:hypothetical protein
MPERAPERDLGPEVRPLPTASLGFRIFAPGHTYRAAHVSLQPFPLKSV